MAAVCVDAGTTLIKAVGYDDDGAEAVVVRRMTTVSHPRPEWAEQDMNAVWNAVAECVREAAQVVGPVDFLSITAQGDGCWLVDADGEPTGPAILWNDGRAAPVVDRWADAGVLREAFRSNGSLTFAGLPNAILSWLREHDPARPARSRAVLTCGGWIYSRLVGQFVTELSEASAPFLDVARRQLSDDLFDLYGVAWAKPLVPPPGPGPVVGRLAPRAAGTVGLPAGTPVVLSPYDVAATALGVGAFDDGQACCILGTTLCTQVVTDRPDLTGEPSGLTIALPDRWLRTFATLAGGGVLSWVRDLLCLADPAAVGDLARRVGPGAGGLVFLPYLSPAGERAPFLDTQARGSLLGLSFEHGREHIARAVLEGLSLVVRDCLAASGVRPVELRLCGGGAASEPWVRLIADVTGVPVRRTADTEAGARGAYLVGQVATTGVTLVDAVRRHVRDRDTFEPDHTEVYDNLYGEFRELREAAADQWPRLAGLRGRA